MKLSISRPLGFLVLFGFVYLLRVFTFPYPFQNENSLNEILSVAFYFLAVVVGIFSLVTKRSLVRSWLILLILVVFLLFLEESSWGQTYLGFESPEWAQEQNAQQETNLHNLSWLQTAKLEEALQEGKFLSQMFKSQNIFRVGFSLFFLAIPLFGNFNFDRGLLSRMRFPYPDIPYLAIIWIPIIVSFAFSLMSDGVVKRGIAETREMIYAIIFFCYLWGLSFPAQPGCRKKHEG